VDPNADPNADPGYQNDAEPCGFGSRSTTMVSKSFWIRQLKVRNAGKFFYI